MRRRFVRALILIGLGADLELWQSGQARALTCSRDDFETVVEQSAAALRKLNAENTPKFQTKLRTLKDKNNWTHEQFLKQAAPFVQDEKIKAFDAETNTLLNKIESLGQGGNAGGEPDCRLLEDLRSHMLALVQTTQAKWTYMNQKIDQGLWAPNQ